MALELIKHQKKMQKENLVTRRDAILKKIKFSR